jgi:hypothetical protein
MRKLFWAWLKLKQLCAEEITNNLHDGANVLPFQDLA